MDLTLENREWKEFLISDVFKVTGTYTTHPKELIKGGKVPRVTCAATDNAFEDTYRNEATEKGGVITIDSATVGYVSYQSTNFIATDHVEKITLKENKFMNRYLGLFFVQIITTASLNKYGYGYKFSQTRMKKQKIMLPINNNNKPDYKFMEQYMRHKEQEKQKEYQNYIQSRLIELKNTPKTVALNEKEWREFTFEDLFKIESTSSGIDRNKLIDNIGNIPYLTRSENNNAYDSFICKQSDKYQLDNSNVITIGLDTQTVFYQPNQFYTGQNIQVLKFEELNKDIAQFLIPLIKTQIEKFNWGGNGATLTRLRRSKLLVPITKDNKPDYKFMEQYMRRVELKKLNEYLACKKN